MENYFAFFRLLSYLGVNDIRAIAVLNKNRLRKCINTGDKRLQKKKNVATLNNVHQDKKQCNFDSGSLQQQQCSSHNFFWILWT